MTLAVFTTTKSEISFPTIEIIKTRLRNKMKAELTDNMIIFERKVNTYKVLNIIDHVKSLDDCRRIYIEKKINTIRKVNTYKVLNIIDHFKSLDDCRRIYIEKKINTNKEFCSNFVS
jgi:hypothetical protein